MIPLAPAKVFRSKKKKIDVKQNTYSRMFPFTEVHLELFESVFLTSSSNADAAELRTTL